MSDEPGAGANRVTAPRCDWRGWAARIGRWCAIASIGLVVAISAAWAAASLYYGISIPVVREIIAFGFPIATLALFLRLRRRMPRALAIYAVTWLLVLLYYFARRPSNTRDWQPDVAELARAEIDGDRITLRNVRFCDYRTETDFDVRHYDKTIDLTELRGVDLFICYWGSAAIAHPMLSFDFGPQGHVCMSIETRKEKGESYSAIAGFFRQYELIYIVADERDVIRVRTNFRQGEDVYLFRTKMSREKARAVFLDYLRAINGLNERPEWYNALTSNCGTNIREHTSKFPPVAPWDTRLLTSGHSDAYVYEHGALHDVHPLPTLREKGHVNPKARDLPPDDEFSTRIRAGVPGF